MILRSKTLLARQLRRDGTDVEKRLWRALREKFPHWKFRRQHPIGKRVVDFACPARKLAIELDGGRHDDRKDADALRSTELVDHGYRVIRFWNNEVFDNIEGVVEAIRLTLENSPPLPDPRRPNGAAREKR